MKKLSGNIVMPSGKIQSGSVIFDTNILEITEDTAKYNNYILPGFIDTHVHGGGGGDTMDGREGIEKMAKMHAKHGTTSFLATTITNPWHKIIQALEQISKVMKTGTGAADLLGAHLEGPFINPSCLGAQPDFAILPNLDKVREVISSGVLRAVTIAPELAGALEAGAQFAKAGIRVGVGHTAASAEVVQKFLQEVGGNCCATHLYNAMGGVQGRSPGAAGELLCSTAFIEIILDCIHVHPSSFKLANLAAKGRVMLITDAIRAAGQGDCISELGGQRVIVAGGEARLESGVLAGSILTMDRALRNAVSIGIPLAEASRMTSSVPASSLGLSDRGHIATGLRADLVVMNQDLEVQDVYINGKSIF